MKISKKRFTSRILQVLFHILPKRMKRLMFLSSLSAKIAQTKCLDASTQQRLKETLHLCKNEKALGFPAEYCNTIWAKREIDSLVCPIYLGTQVQDEQLTRTARMIVAIMPCWLVYDSISKIVADVRTLLVARGELFHV